jgi:type II secretory pathway component HofQ
MENTLPAAKKNGISGNNPDLLGVIAQQNSDKSGKQLPTTEIIKQDAHRNGLNPDQILQTIAKLKLSSQNIQTVKIGNTVFLLLRTPPSTVEVHTFTVDKPNVMVSHFKNLIKFLKKAGIKKGFTFSEEPLFKQMVERSGMPVQITQTIKQIGNEMKPVYQYTMDL